ncbi:hypothetical protein [Devosia sp.]|uniref:hypothetical protein n=1 Tax=Devosia sp. TaxID=1871048 RepID=UPI003A92E7F5
MATKEEEFKVRFAAIMADIGESGRKDSETMLMMGSLASTMIDSVERKSWKQFKSKLTEGQYSEALTGLQNGGNAAHREGKTKTAYVAQALGASLVASKQHDKDIKEWVKTLDDLIERAITVYRTVPTHRRPV